MPVGPYDQDALIWSEQQADLLRRLAPGERANDAVDRANVIEEVQDVGQSQLRSCQGLLRQAMLPLLKLHAWPASQAAGHWREEASTLLDDAALYFAPSMRQRIDLAALYAKALRQAASATDESGPALHLPNACPFPLDALLSGEVPELVEAVKAGPSEAELS
ncbi:MAG: DUF29 family protein [Janthinobacterium lividum]